jgi:hypothetical protein
MRKVLILGRARLNPSASKNIETQRRSECAAGLKAHCFAGAGRKTAAGGVGGWGARAIRHVRVWCGRDSHRESLDSFVPSPCRYHCNTLYTAAVSESSCVCVCSGERVFQTGRKRGKGLLFSRGAQPGSLFLYIIATPIPAHAEI